MMVLLGIGLIMLLAVIIVALVYRGKVTAEQHQAEMQRQRAEAAEVINNSRQQLDAALTMLHETHREETIYATDPTHLAARDDFANAWPDSDRLHGTGAGADHAASAAVTDAAGTAVHFINRPDLR